MTQRPADVTSATSETAADEQPADREPDRLVLDLETQRSFAEVGGAHNRERLGVSVVGVYHYRDDRFLTFREDALDALEPMLRAADEIIGFNLIGFDWPVLAAELGDWVRELPTLDLMVEVQRALGHRLSLDALAEATLGAHKSGSGLDALEHYKQGDWEALERYCLDDVRLTRDLYEYANRHGHLLYNRRGGRQRRSGGQDRGVIPVSFAESPFAAIFRQAATRRGSVRIVYGAKERLVDVHRFDGSYIRGYCHLRREVLTFRLDRVEAAEAVASSEPLF